MVEGHQTLQPDVKYIFQKYALWCCVIASVWSEGENFANESEIAYVDIAKSCIRPADLDKHHKMREQIPGAGVSESTPWPPQALPISGAAEITSVRLRFAEIKFALVILLFVFIIRQVGEQRASLIWTVIMIDSEFKVTR